MARKKKETEENTDSRTKGMKIAEKKQLAAKAKKK